jgi:hypothetical protein
MKKASSVLCLIALFVTVVQPVAAETVLSEFRVRLINGERFEGHNGVLGDQGFEWVASDGAPLSVPLEDIRALDECTGNKAGKKAAIGAGIGFATALLGYIVAESEASSDPYKEVDNSRVAPLFFGFTGVGALIGLAIGSSQKQWKKVPIEASLGFSPERSEIRLALNLPF